MADHRTIARSIGWLLCVLLAALWIYMFAPPAGGGATDASYSELLQAVRAGRVEAVVFKDKTITATLKTAKAAAQPDLLLVGRLPENPDTELIQALESSHIRYSGHSELADGWLQTVLLILIPLLVMAGFVVLNARRMRQSEVMTFGRNRARIYDQSAHIKVSFEDVAGVDEAKAELVEIVDFLQNPLKYQRLGGRIPRGVLLVGPPGTGKTLLAKALAGEAGVAFFSISGSNFVEMFVGVGAARVRDLFEQAKAKAPCIVFIDELDAIGKSRSGARGAQSANDEREQTLNQLLVEMDGFDTSEAVIIVAATNAPELLDTALVRPGRFDRQVIVDRPDLAGREAILRVHARNVQMSPSVNLATIAARTPGMTGSDLANVVNEAALLAAQRGAAQIQTTHLEEAIDRVMLGLEKRTRLMTDQEKERVAYHEGGHALAALSVAFADPVHRISIIPRSVAALGYTLQLPTHERFLLTRSELEDRIAVMLGGRAAEQLAFHGEISTGASDDLEKASELVRQMVTRFGMSEHLGQVIYGHPLGSSFSPRQCSTSCPEPTATSQLVRLTKR